MRFVSFVFVLAGCGPMYRQPTPSTSSPPPDPAASGGTDPWQDPSAGGPPGQPAAWHGGPDDSSAPRPAPSAPPASEPATSAPAGSIAQRFVDAHNRVRAKHCAPPLVWSPKLAQVAQSWANTLKSKGCVFGHSGGQYGENLAAGTEGVLDPEATVKMWYDELAKYHFPDGGFSMQTGHFTQVVWRGTKQVGCGHAICRGNDIWVCNYDPAGNWDGQYRENVLPASCKK